jgi:hypothetical protein
MGGIKNSLVIVIAIVERRPKCELPGPAFIHIFSNFVTWKA